MLDAAAANPSHSLLGFSVVNYPQSSDALISAFANRCNCGILIILDALPFQFSQFEVSFVEALHQYLFSQNPSSSSHHANEMIKIFIILFSLNIRFIIMREQRKRYFIIFFVKNIQDQNHSVISNQAIQLNGKSSVFITMDLSWSPALKAILFTSLNLLSTIPGTPSKAAKGGTAPGCTPSFLTSSSLHILAFFVRISTFLSLLQLILRFARQRSIKIDYLPKTSMVFDPHSRGVFLSQADSLDVLVAECWIIQNLMLFEVRQFTIREYTSYLGSVTVDGLKSSSFYINYNQQQKNHLKWLLSANKHTQIQNYAFFIYSDYFKGQFV